MRTNDCTQIERLLPLHAGGDLSSREAAQVDAHLAVCASCQNELAALSDGRTWLTGLAASAPEFNDAQLGAMRATVLREIKRDSHQSKWAWLAAFRPARLAFAGLALLLALGALGFLLRRAAAPDELIALPRAQEQRIVPGEGVARPSPVTATKLSPKAHPKTIRLRPAVRRTAPQQADLALAQRALPDSASLSPANADDAPTTEPLRIEIQTADPNIRIIWLASSADASSLHLPTTK